MRATKTQTQRSSYRRRCPGATPLTRSGLPFEGKDLSGSCAWRMDGRMGERGEETEGALWTRQDGGLAKHGGNGEQKRGTRLREILEAELTELADGLGVEVRGKELMRIMLWFLA